MDDELRAIIKAHARLDVEIAQIAVELQRLKLLALGVRI